MAEPSTSKAFIPSWSSAPIPSFTLSASGLLALADLQTISNRTALTGGSSWLDALVLAPGLHYQQAANVVDGANKPAFLAAIEDSANVQSQGTRDSAHGVAEEDSASLQYAIVNMAMLRYLQRVRDDGRMDDVTLDVSMDPETQRERITSTLKGLLRRQRKRRAMADVQDLPPHVDWYSNFLYLLSPLLTAVAITFMIFLRDWWGLGTTIALVVSRILNIFTIKQRVQPPRSPHSRASTDTLNTAGIPEDTSPRQCCVKLDNGRQVHLRGSKADLEAVTTHAWMRDKTDVEGFMEAAAKLIVYLVAALSGNISQVGSIIQMGLLLCSAALLGLSNARNSGFRMHGRVARVQHSASAKPASTAASGRLEQDGRRPRYSRGNGEARVQSWTSEDQMGQRSQQRTRRNSMERPVSENVPQAADVAGRRDLV